MPEARCLALLVLFAARGAAAQSADEESAVVERLAGREQILESQTKAAATTARERTLLTYRMARRRELGFVANPESRLDAAQSFDVAMVALRRSLDETRTLARELDRVRNDRATLESALAARAPRTAGDEREEPLARLPRPARGARVATPGVRRDGPTKVELRHDSVQILARLNDPVRAIAPGVVKRVEPLAPGGFAVVLAHPDGSTSIVTGLRDFAVKVGDSVTLGQTLGFAGRNLDGAAVISVELWRQRRPVDAGKLVR